MERKPLDPEAESQMGFLLPNSIRLQLRREADKLRRNESWLLREILAERYEAAREEAAPMVE